MTKKKPKQRNVDLQSEVSVQPPKYKPITFGFITCMWGPFKRLNLLATKISRRRHCAALSAHHHPRSRVSLMGKYILLSSTSIIVVVNHNDFLLI